MTAQPQAPAMPSMTLRIPGRLPTNTAALALRQAHAMTAMPTGTRTERMMDEVTPRTSIAAITRDLGMDASTEIVWQKYLRGALEGTPTEMQARQALVAKMREERLPAPLQKAIMLRAMSFYREAQVRKSDAQSLDKATAAIFARCAKAITDALDAPGAEGVAVTAMDGYVDTFGVDILGQVLQSLIEEGVVTFDGYRLWPSNGGPRPVMVASLSKAEGARGGQILGHTKSGKPIYSSTSKAAHRNYEAARPPTSGMHFAPKQGDISATALKQDHPTYTKDDHLDAASAHDKHAEQASSARTDAHRRGDKGEARKHDRAHGKARELASTHRIAASTLDKALSKASAAAGPGSRGGAVIGRTTSGKAIYADHPSGAASYTHADHTDAADAHAAHAAMTSGDKRKHHEFASRYHADRAAKTAKSGMRMDLFKAKYISREKKGGRWVYTYPDDHKPSSPGGEAEAPPAIPTQQLPPQSNIAWAPHPKAAPVGYSAQLKDPHARGREYAGADKAAEIASRISRNKYDSSAISSARAESYALMDRAVADIKAANPSFTAADHHTAVKHHQYMADQHRATITPGDPKRHKYVYGARSDNDAIDAVWRHTGAYMAHRQAAEGMTKSFCRTRPRRPGDKRKHSLKKSTVMVLDMAKAEGSRGGHVIGRTKSGKAIYQNAHASSPSYKDFSAQDHHDAARLHGRINKVVQQTAKNTKRPISDDDAYHGLKQLGHERHVKLMSGAKSMNKAEGSRGGHIIAHTKSGKPVYASGSGHEGFSAHDHREAAAIHAEHASIANHAMHQFVSTKQDMGSKDAKDRYGKIVQGLHDQKLHHEAASAKHHEMGQVKTNRARVGLATAKTMLKSEGSRGGDHDAVIHHQKMRTKHRQKSNSTEKSMAEDMEKTLVWSTSGAGSRGGRVIGRTKSGKSIYATAEHTHSYTKQDHADAAEHHAEHAAHHEGLMHEGDAKTKKMHQRTMQMHSNLADQHMSHAKKSMAEKSMKSEAAEYLAKSLNGKSGGLPTVDRMDESDFYDNPVNGGGFPTKNAGDASGAGTSGKSGMDAVGAYGPKSKVVRNAGDAKGAGTSGDAGNDWKDGVPVLEEIKDWSQVNKKKARESAAKSSSSYTQQELHHEVAHRNATGMLKSMLIARGGEDVTTGMGVAPPPQAPKQMAKSVVVQRGAITHVDSGLDARASELVKGDSFYSGQAPQLHAPHGALTRSVMCKSCESMHSALYSACPACGVGGVLQKSYGASIATQGVLGQPSAGGAGLAPVTHQDIYAPTLSLAKE